MSTQRLVILFAAATVFMLVMAGCIDNLKHLIHNTQNPLNQTQTVQEQNQYPHNITNVSDNKTEPGPEQTPLNQTNIINETENNATVEQIQNETEHTMTDDEILEWLSSPAVWPNKRVNDSEKRNYECADDTLLRYEKLKDKTYGIWERDYDTCGNAKKGEVYFLSLGLKESPDGNDDWQYVSHNASRGIYQFKNNMTGVELMYMVNNWPEGYGGGYDDTTKFTAYFASTICRLPECASGKLSRADVKHLTINGYDAYLMHNSDWSGVEVAFFATPCQIDRCHDYGETYIYISLRGDKDNVLQTLHDITHNLLIKPQK